MTEQPEQPEPISRSRTADRDFDIWRRYTDGETQAEIAKSLGMSQARVSKIISNVKDDVPIEERRARQRRALAELDEMRQRVWEILDRKHLTVSNGQVVRWDGEPLADVGPVLAAMEQLRRIQEREAKALGTDAVTRVSVDAENLGAEILGLLGKFGGGPNLADDYEEGSAG